MSIELLNCDCLEYMKEQPDNSFDLLITSPPYNMNLRVNSNGYGYCSRQVTKEISTKYSNFADNLPMKDYEMFLDRLISEANRISKMSFINIQQITGNKPAMFSAIGKHSDKIKETIIWDKISTSPAINEWTLSSAFEFIFVFGGNPITRQFRDANFTRGTESNVWRIPTEKRSNKEHGAGYPLALPEKILNLFGFKGAKVIDPFLGTGTTAIAAHYFGCDFVGVEIDEDYYKAACERFDRETRQLAMF